MNKTFGLYCLSLVLSLFILVPTQAAVDPDQYQFTEASLKKFDAVSRDLKSLNLKKNDEEKKSREDQTIEGYARKIESEPQAMAVLKKHGVSSTEFAQQTFAMLPAAMYLAFESSMPKDKAASLFASYPKTRQANIELLRKHPEYMNTKK